MKKYNNPNIEIIDFSVADDVLSINNSGEYNGFGDIGQAGVWDMSQTIEIK